MNNKVGISICLSDHHENFIKAKTTRYAPVLLVKEGEANGLLQAIKWTSKLGLNNVIFELDAKLVVDSFNKP